MTKKRPLGLPSARLIIIAAIAGLIAGVLAVYVNEGTSGNGALSAAAVECKTATPKVEALKAAAKGQMASLVAATPPRLLPVLNFRDAAGQKKTLADFKGKLLLVNLWATWCIPCREEMPALNTLDRQRAGTDFDVVAINIDSGSDEKPKNFLNEHAVDHLALYRDDTMSVFNALKQEGLAFGLPATLVLDKNGCLIGSMNGPASWDGEDARKLIDQIAGL